MKHSKKHSTKNTCTIHRKYKYTYYQNTHIAGKDKILLFSPQLPDGFCP